MQTKKSVKSNHLWQSVIQTAYDIITKEHNGTIKVESKVDVADSGLSGKRNPDNFGKGEESAFVITLPV